MSEEIAESTEAKECAPKEKKRFTILGVEVAYLYLFGIWIAHIGWLVENIAKAISSQHFIDSRFHLLPFIWPYSLIILAFHLVLRDPDDIVFFGKRIFPVNMKHAKLYSNILGVFIMCSFVFLGELAVGNLWDVFFGVELWNYSSMPLTVTQYTSIFTTLGYGGGVFLIFKFIYKPVLNFIRKKVNYTVAKVICLTLGVAIFLDTLYMMLSIIIFGEAPMYWNIHF